ncbi:MAG: prepilin-type N-terminal cleavage/methylation domain-containing protein [Phycisphaeraceae bacterium]|nr:prepilin-type N-terminal cleavage/methylation domain-containing protein [Phycisphaeraceae bacterium]
MRTRVSKAFTLVEILIVVVILGILAAIVIPQFTNASQEAQTGNIQTQLQTLRNQIELFRVRNNGDVPAIAGDQDGSFDDLLAGTGNTFGLGDDNSLGRAQQPYTRNRPVNPRNGRNEVAESANPRTDAAAAAADPDGPGWFYNSTSGEIAAAGFDEDAGTWVTNQ